MKKENIVQKYCEEIWNWMDLKDFVGDWVSTKSNEENRFRVFDILKFNERYKMNLDENESFYLIKRKVLESLLEKAPELFI